MPFDYQSYPEDDSPDLADEEIAGATDTSSPHQFSDVLGDALIHLSCGSCGGHNAKVHSSLKRRKPHVYSRSEFTCPCGHVWRKTYRIDWLLRS